MRDRFIIIIPFLVSAMINESTISYLKEIIWVMLVMRNPLVLAFYHSPVLILVFLVYAFLFLPLEIRGTC